jgi:cell division septum initiation protein DivIVA
MNPSSDHELPSSFRGYDRAATHAFLARVEDAYRELVTERDELLERSEALERELGEFREQAHAVSLALVRAEELRVEAERDAEAIRSEAEHVAAEALEQAHREADHILSQASRRADALVVDAEELIDSAKEHITGLVRDLFERAGVTRSREDGSNGFHEVFAEQPSQSDPASD